MTTCTHRCGCVLAHEPAQALADLLKKATPRPCLPISVISRSVETGYVKIYGLRDAQGRKLAEADQRDPKGLSIAEADEAWAYIVRAVNAYDAMRDALMAVLRFRALQPHTGLGDAANYPDINPLPKVRAALRAAEGKVE